MEHAGLHIYTVELKVLVQDYTGKNIRGRLMTFRGNSLEAAFRNALLYAKDHPECFPTGLIEANELLSPPWRVKNLGENPITCKANPPRDIKRPSFKKPKRPQFKKRK